MGAVQAIVWMGLALTPVYLIGLIFAGVVMARRGPSRELAGWTWLAHLTPAAVTLLLMLLLVDEMALNQTLPNSLGYAIAVASVALGPIMSVILLVDLIQRRFRRGSRSVSPMLLIAGGCALLLAACGQSGETPAEAPADAAAETAPAAEPSDVAAPPSDAALTAASPEQLTLARLRSACRATIAVVHEQSVEAVRVEGLEGTTVNLSWPAPVDGGRRTAQCRIEGPLVTWRPTGLPDPGQMRWMNQASDPVISYAVDGERIVVTQLFPDGTTATAKAPVAAEEEVR